MQSITITRGQLGQFGSFLGGISLLTGILGLLWQGSLTLYIAGFLLVGILGMALWAIMTPEDFRGFITGRQMRYSTVSFFSTLLLIGIVALTYIIVEREVIIGDMTIDGRFTLTEETETLLQVARRTPERIQITGFYYPEDLVQREIDDQYIQLYVDATDGHISRRYVNPIEEPAFSDRYLPYIAQGVNVFISFIDDDGDIISQTVLPVPRSGQHETDLTQAIARLMVSGQFKIYFETGLDTPDPLAPEQSGMSIINNMLRSNGFITEPLNLEDLAASGQPVPQDASAIIIAQPRRQMSAAELALVDTYLQEGGALFIAADMYFTDDLFLGPDSAFNQYLWEQFGLRMTTQVVVDPASSSSTELDILSALVYGNSAIGRNLNVEGQPQTSTLFRIARAVDVNDDPPVQNGRIIMSSPESWGETDLDSLNSRNEFAYDEGTDVPGPLTTVAWAYNTDTDAQIVLVGDGDFITNGQIAATQGNPALVLDSLGWMTGFSQATEFQPQAFATTPVLAISGEQLNIIAFVTVILMPGVMLIAAAAIYIRRLRQ